MVSMKGSILIASPSLLDPNFHHTVVFVAEHNEEGAFGLVLNRPTEAKVGDLWQAISDQVSSSSSRTFIGGPVQKNLVLVLHGYPDLARDAEPVVPGVYLGGEVDVLGELLRRESESEGPGKFRVYCGYSGWGEGQLDSELKAGGWLSCLAQAGHVFHEAPERLWNEALDSLGGVYRFFALMPRNPEMN